MFCEFSGSEKARVTGMNGRAVLVLRAVSARAGTVEGVGSVEMRIVLLTVRGIRLVAGPRQ